MGRKVIKNEIWGRVCDQEKYVGWVSDQNGGDPTKKWRMWDGNFFIMVGIRSVEKIWQEVG